MKICIINGSPKAGENTSELLIGALVSKFRETDEVRLHRIMKKGFGEALYRDMAECSALVFAFPLYVDSIPSHLLRLLVDLKENGGLSPKTAVYCILNNGFFEGTQNRIAAEQMKNWCAAAGLKWGQAIGVGAGEMLPFLKEIPLGHGPYKNLGRALETFAENLLNRRTGEDLFLSPKFPRALWRFQASHSVWLPRAKKNGLKRKDLFRREHS